MGESSGGVPAVKTGKVIIGRSDSKALGNDRQTSEGGGRAMVA